ncbi:aromatic ring-hydroxylating dioxygenase subunit alpha [Pseudomonas sp. MWU16-30317]|uniref:aromatic ring-hydroxylating dioxygenase subunit alpha n=1 Tax=Pseudomonas sp. MWU16-30317 TaxID=2878095 RepID=UPI001CFC1FEE|nr:aromatic ring-hydroxylating dioxygenase subunit alpha [Pseudomonas sp. MWU16-30317]
MYLRNAWYVAASENEIGDGLFPTTLLGEPVVLFRKADGQIKALEDACPHRKLPLSMGRLDGDQVECGYHGLTFDSEGTCTRAPTSARIPARAKVHSYPLQVRYGLVWLWMGDPALADPASLCEVPEWGDPLWGLSCGASMTVPCNYLYMTDNLLDPSHVAWVHQSSFGNAACASEPVTVTETANGVIVSRWMRNVEVAPFYAQFVTFAGPCDRLQHYEVQFPCQAIIKAVFTPAGTGHDDAPMHEEVFLMNSYNFMTPVDAHTTRYYWFQMRNFDPDNDAVSRRFDEDVQHAFAEDRAVLAAVHKGMLNPRTAPINLPSDAGPIKFRRELARRIALQSAEDQHASESLIASTAT